MGAGSIMGSLIERKKRLMMMQTYEHTLPAEYQQVEYIQSVDRAKIDSGVLMTADLVMIMDFAFVEVIKQKYYAGTYSANQGDFYLYTNNSSIPLIETAWGTKYGNTTFVADTQKHKIRYSVDLSNNIGTATIDGETVFSKSLLENFPSRTIIIAGTPNTYSPGIRTYSAKFIKSGAVIRNFIPCYRIADDEPGLYDLANNVFYTATGVGEFIIPT